MHYSRITTAPNKTYSAAAAVLLNELLKGSVSVIIALKRIDVEMKDTATQNEKDPRSLNRAAPSRLPPYLQASRIQNLSRQVLSPDCYKLAVPAILYVIQNNLQYVAATNLDVATFQVTYQMKILTTAFFSVILLRKRLSRAKWIALIMLAVGVGIVQIQSTSTSAHVSSGPGAHASQSGASLRSEIPEESVVIPVRVMHPLRGFIAVTLACMTSGLAGVYFEYILKSSSGSAPPPDLWVRNTQLSLFSLIPALVPILFGGSDDPSLGWLAGVVNKFSHFNGWALGTVLTQTFGGLITAIVIRYSDNIM
jgi:UDP-sugar transporter A1/2/3